jgi:ISXO2 transposase-like protein
MAGVPALPLQHPVAQFRTFVDARPRAAFTFTPRGIAIFVIFLLFCTPIHRFPVTSWHRPLLAHQILRARLSPVWILLALLFLLLLLLRGQRTTFSPGDRHAAPPRGEPPPALQCSAFGGSCGGTRRPDETRTNACGTARSASGRVPNRRQALSWIKARVAKGTTLHADEGGAWNDLHGRYEMKRINHQEAYSLDGACTNWAELPRERFRSLAHRVVFAI